MRCLLSIPLVWTILFSSKETLKKSKTGSKRIDWVREAIKKVCTLNFLACALCITDTKKKKNNLGQKQYYLSPATCHL